MFNYFSNIILVDLLLWIIVKFIIYFIIIIIKNFIQQILHLNMDIADF
jgi:hypothetical protein